MLLFIVLQGGSAFSPSLVQTASASRRQAIDLARELGCVTSDVPDDGPMVACLRSTPVHRLNAAQTKVWFLDSGRFLLVLVPAALTRLFVLQLLAVSGPFLSWSPVPTSRSSESFQRVDLLLGTSEHDGLISRARKIKVRGHNQLEFYKEMVT